MLGGLSSTKFNGRPRSTIVAVNPSKKLPERSLSLEELRNRCDIVNEGVDSTTWEISVQNEELRRKLANIFS